MSDVPPPRPRRDPRAQARPPRARAEPPAPAPARARRVIDDPACLVLAVPDLDDGRLSSHDRDMMGTARGLADALGGAVVLIAFADSAEDFGGAGADRVMRFAEPAFAGYAPEARAAAVVAVVASLRPRHVLFPDGAGGGGDLGRRVAAALGERPAANVQRLGADEVSSRGNGGASDYIGRPPLLLLIAPEAADPVAGAAHEARPLDPVPVAVATRLVDRGLAAVDANAVPLAEADFVVAAGNGVTDWAAFHAAAAALGATEAGSRVVCDAGLLPRERQVGASGTLVEPRCYLAFGIAGAPQHLQGIARCERVVAVNTDLHAEMVKRADLAVIADAQQVMPALVRLLREKPRGP
ncbi:MAG: electron transfer flavoprotein subunit alpha/FixB family protein [Dongiaceae bacterium]